MSDLTDQFLVEIKTRLDRIAANPGPIEAAVDACVESLKAGGVLQAFGTGHSEAFAMEVAGRAGGLIATNRIPLHNVVQRGTRDVSVLRGPTLEQDPTVVDELWDMTPIEPNDIFLIASNSGVNGSIVGMALKAKENGHKVIAVTSLEHTNGVPVKHSSGKRLCDVADITIDNLAPYGDATVKLDGGIGMGAVSSITAAYIAQLITLGIAEKMQAEGETPPVYLSANIPGGNDRNVVLEEVYGERIRRDA